MSSISRNNLTLFAFIKAKMQQVLIFIVPVTLLLGASFSSQAVSLTSYRIYLDGENRTESFIVFAKGSDAEQCSLNLKHFDFTDDGKMSLNIDKELPENSAQPWVRFSPKHFTLQPKRPQTIRFSMKRRPNMDKKEYRSYLSIACEKLTNPEVNNDAKELGRPTLQVKPKLVQNVPIIIRTGDLDVSAKFTDMMIEDGKLTGKITRSGERSLYGRLALINKNNNEELSYTTGISIYPETTRYSFDFGLKGKNFPPLDQLLVRFTEDENYGGSLIIEKNLK